MVKASFIMMSQTVFFDIETLSFKHMGIFSFPHKIMLVHKKFLKLKAFLVGLSDLASKIIGHIN